MVSTTIGLLGASTIAPVAVVGPASQRPDAEVAVVAARDVERAARFAQRWGIPRVAASYHDVVEDPAVDLVYVSTAAVDHAAWTIAALEAGKDVLCEKPAVTTLADAHAVAAVAERSGRLVVEGFHDQWHPLAAWVRDVVTAADFGPVERLAGTVIGHRPPLPGSVLHDAALGGGALRHSGCYAVHWMRLLTGEEPVVEAFRPTLGPFGADEESVLDLAFPSGAVGRVVSSFARDRTMADPPELVVESRSHRLEVSGLIVPHAGHRAVLDGVDRREEGRGPRTTYDHQLDAVLAARTDPMLARTLRDDLVGQAAVLAAASSRSR